jgi:hypothetical protein
MGIAPTFVLLVVTEPSANPTVYGGTFSILQHALFPAEVMQYLFKNFTAPSVRTDLVDPVSGMAPMKAFSMSAPRVSGPSGVIVFELLLGGDSWRELDALAPMFHCFVSCLDIERTSGAGSFPFCHFLE